MTNKKAHLSRSKCTAVFSWLMSARISMTFALFAVIALYLTTQQVSAQDAPTNIWETAQYQSCFEKLPAREKRYFAKVTQKQLSDLYQQNSDYPQSQVTLNDGKYGPITRRWLAYFCAEFAVEIPDTSAAFIESLLIALSRASQLNALYPIWRTKIAANELLYLSAPDIIERLTSNPENQAQNIEFSSPEYFLLTEKNISSLAQRQTIIEELTETTATQSFEKRGELYKILQQSFLAAGVNPKSELLNIDDLIQSVTLPPPSKAETPQQVWQVNPQALQKIISDLNIVAIPKEVIQSLQPLKGELFHSRYMMKQALKMKGISPSDQAAKSILSMAKKSGDAPEINIQMNWKSTPYQGCQGGKAAFQEESTFYGFYPYWNRPEEGSTINFSQLDRIGYVGAVVKLTPRGSKLFLPPNWNTNPKQSKFIQTAHNYRSNIDLVITLPENHSAEHLVATFSDKKLVTQLVQSITQPLDKPFINKMKPWLSFGMASVPTIGDGITLDIDLSSLNTKESQQAFLNFVEKLKTELNLAAGISEETAQKDDRYFLNLVVPIHKVLEKKSNHFYNYDNFDELTKSVNLFIMRSSDPASSEETHDEITQIQELQRWLSFHPTQSKATTLYKRMVPMLVTEDTHGNLEQLDQLAHLSSWSFLGAAYWPIPLHGDSHPLIEETFFPPAKALPEPLQSMVVNATHVFNYVCPDRWPIIMILFGAFVIIIPALTMSIWHYPIRPYLTRKPFVLFSAASMTGLNLVFIADPHFKDYQVPILIGFMIAIVGIFMVVQWITKEGDKP